jgi:hypothetical protein
MDKYSDLHALMGGLNTWNDKAKGGRILKWKADTQGASKKVRDVKAQAIFTRIAHLPYVKRVEVKNWVSKGFVGPDKICVYIDDNLMKKG